MIQFDSSMFADYAAVQDHMADYGGGNVRITADSGETLVLIGVQVSQLSSSDFMIVKWRAALTVRCAMSLDAGSRSILPRTVRANWTCSEGFYHSFSPVPKVPRTCFSAALRRMQQSGGSCAPAG